MECFKRFSISIVVLASALLGLGSSPSSATELYTTGTGGESEHQTLGSGTQVAASLEAGSTLSLASTSEEPIVTCTESSLKGELGAAGGAGSAAKITVSHLTFSGSCSSTVEQSKNGSLEIHQIAGTTNGTVTGKGFYWTVHSPFVGACNYGFGSSNIDLDTLTGSTSGTATWHLNAIITEQEPKRLLCPDTTRWIGKFVFIAPDPLFVELG